MRLRKSILGGLAGILFSFGVATADDIVDKINESVYCIRNIGIYNAQSLTDAAEDITLTNVEEGHGTGFAFKREDGCTYLMSNAHVVFLPLTMDYDDAYDQDNPRKKLVKQEIKIVDDKNDRFKDDDIPLEIVAMDHEKDISILRTEKELPIFVPETLSRDSLNTGEAVMMLGFPLAETKALTKGVISNLRYSHLDFSPDLKSRFDHEDIIVDCATNPGNSGSPTFVKRGDKYFLVGILHAGYRRAEGMKLVVPVDDFTYMMGMNEVQKSTSGIERIVLNPEDKARIVSHIGESDINAYGIFGHQTAMIRMVDNRLQMTIFFTPLTFDGDHTDKLVLEDDGEDGYSSIDRVRYVTQQKKVELTRDNFTANQERFFHEVYRLIAENYLQLIDYRENHALGGQDKEKQEEADRIFSQLMDDVGLENMLLESVKSEMEYF